MNRLTKFLLAGTMVPALALAPFAASAQAPDALRGPGAQRDGAPGGGQRGPAGGERAPSPERAAPHAPAAERAPPQERAAPQERMAPHAPAAERAAPQERTAPRAPAAERAAPQERVAPPRAPAAERAAPQERVAPPRAPAAERAAPQERVAPPRAPAAERAPTPERAPAAERAAPVTPKADRATPPARAEESRPNGGNAAQTRPNAPGLLGGGAPNRAAAPNARPDGATPPARAEETRPNGGNAAPNAAQTRPNAPGLLGGGRPNTTAPNNVATPNNNGALNNNGANNAGPNGQRDPGRDNAGRDGNPGENRANAGRDNNGGDRRGDNGRDDNRRGDNGRDGDRRGNGIGVGGAAAIGAAAGFAGGFLAATGAQNLEGIRRDRRETVEDGRTYIREPGRTIVDDGGRSYVVHDENDRFRQLGYDVRRERDGSNFIDSVDRPDGTRILTYTTPDGRMLRRVRRYRDGREYVLIDNSYEGGVRSYQDDVIDLPPPRIGIPRDRYAVAYQDVDESVLYDTFVAPPLQAPPRRYTLDQIRYSPDVRRYVRSVDINTINFDTGSWIVPAVATGKLQALASAIKKTIAKDPNTVFLVEGFTDATGNPNDNLSLSDRRAQSVAAILSKSFGVPPENLTTQGYGQQDLKENTQGPSAINRRVVVQNITPLLAAGGQPPR